MTTKAPPSTTGRGLLNTQNIVNNNDAIIARMSAGQQTAISKVVTR